MSGEALKPNCTQCPNEILDRLLPILSPSQFKLVMAIVRKTYGWHKKSDDISLTQLERMTGMSRQTVIDASTPLRASGFIVIGRSGRRGVLNYSLNINVDTESLVKTLDQSKNLTSLKNTTSLVQILDTQKKLTKENKNGAKAPSVSSPSRRGKKLTRPDPAQVEAFARFYSAYPRHVDREAAQKAWFKLSPNPELVAEIMAGVERYAETVKDSEPKFIKHPGPWLSARRWEDEPAGGNGNGRSEGPPRIIKREADILTLADGSIMPAGTYQRKYGISP
jgi:phage replication O-like protein O